MAKMSDLTTVEPRLPTDPTSRSSGRFSSLRSLRKASSRLRAFRAWLLGFSLGFLTCAIVLAFTISFSLGDRAFLLDLAKSSFSTILFTIPVSIIAFGYSSYLERVKARESFRKSVLEQQFESMRQLHNKISGIVMAIQRELQEATDGERPLNEEALTSIIDRLHEIQRDASASNWQIGVAGLDLLDEAMDEIDKLLEDLGSQRLGLSEASARCFRILEDLPNAADIFEYLEYDDETLANLLI